MNNKIPFGLIILAVAIGGFMVSLLGHDTFMLVYSIVGILVMILSYSYFSRKKL